MGGRRGFRQRQSLSGDLFGFVIGYAVTVATVALMRPRQVLAFHLPAFLPLLLLAPFAGIACILLEYVAGILLLFIQTKKLVTRVTIDSSYSAVPRIGVLDVLSVLALVIGEEIMLRQLLYNLLATDLAMAPCIVTPLCAAAYALNHLSFGVRSVISKLPSGLIYVLLFYVSGLSIAVVIIAHTAQNLTLLAWSRKQRS